MNKICLYTCITGNYDFLKDIKFKENNTDYICFTNNKNIKSKTWKIVYLEEKIDNWTLARKVKILPKEYLEKYDLTIWVDGSIEILKPISEFLDKECELDKYDMVGFKHQERDCIYEEINVNAYLMKENTDKLIKVKQFLKSENYPEHNGLIESSILVRKNNSEVNKLMNLWFKTLNKLSNRDQLSFNYCLYKNPIKIKLIDAYAQDNKYFKNNWHNKNENINKILFVYYGKLPQKINDYEIENLDLIKYNYDSLDNGIDIPIKISCSEINLIFKNEPYSEIIKEYKIDKANIYKNSLIYDNKHYFSGNPIITIKKDFKKNTKLKYKLKLKETSINDIVISMNNSIINLMEEKRLENLRFQEIINKINTHTDVFNEELEAKKYELENINHNIIIKIINKIKRIKFIKKEKVSIIIPTYNDSKYIIELIESLINQTYKNIEILIVDDGSTDNTQEICTKYSKQDKRVRYFKQKNSGPGRARNLAIKHSKGKYIMFADSDDYLQLNAVEIAVNNIKKRNLDMVNFNGACFYDGVDVNNTFIKPDRYLKKHYYYKVYSGIEYFDTLRKNSDFSSVVWGFIYKKSIIKNNKLLFSSNPYHDDVQFSFECLMKSSKVGYIKDILYNRRVRENSITTSRKLIKSIYSYYNMINYIKENYDTSINCINNFINDLETMMINQIIETDVNDFKTEEKYNDPKFINDVLKIKGNNK